MKYLKILSVIGSLALSLIATSAFGAERLKMATIAPGTSAYLTMTTFASLVNQNQDDFDITVDATGAATKHGIELAKGKLDFCMSAPTVHFFLKKGKAMYQKLENHAELAEKLNLVMWFPYGQYHYITYADSGIKTFADMKGKKIFLNCLMRFLVKINSRIVIHVRLCVNQREDHGRVNDMVILQMSQMVKCLLWH